MTKVKVERWIIHGHEIRHRFTVKRACESVPLSKTMNFN